MATQNIQAWQIKAIYARGGELGMVERGNDSDALHTLVAGLTGHESVKQLTSAEASTVIDELKQRMKLQNQSAPSSAPKRKKEHVEIRGGVTEEQQRKAWWLMYQIAKFDLEPSKAEVPQRLFGMIEKQFKVTAIPKEPFRFLSREQGAELIEALKSIATQAELKYIHSDRYRKEKAGGKT